MTASSTANPPAHEPPPPDSETGKPAHGETKIHALTVMPGSDIYRLQSQPPKTIRITVELTEEQAACIWADCTWGGLQPKAMTEIIGDICRTAARTYRRAFPSAVAKDVERFRVTMESEVAA